MDQVPYLAIALEPLDGFAARWQRALESLRNAGVVEALVLRDIEVLRAAEPQPSWSHLLLLRLRESAPGLADALMDDKELAGALGCAELIRAEYLLSTPNSHFPAPSAAALAQSDPPAMTIEYIDVAPDRLSDYRESMVRNSGPALGHMWAAGQLNILIALETVEVIRSRSDAPQWNQIHVAESFFATSDAFVLEFDKALRAVNPASDGYREIFGELAQMRTHRRVSLVERVPELALA